MRRPLILCTAAALLPGCRVQERLIEQRLPPARLEVEYRPEARKGAVTFDFARVRSTSGVVYGHKASFVATTKVSRVGFEKARPLPETWLLTWEEAETRKRHQVWVVVTSRGKQPRIELQAAGGRLVGAHDGPNVQLRLLPDGQVLPADALDPAPPPPLPTGEEQR